MQPIVTFIELWPVDKLIPYAKNPRTHSENQVAEIATSIAEFGFNNPILVDTKAGIIAGHGRLLAARKLQLTCLCASRKGERGMGGLRAHGKSQYTKRASMASVFRAFAGHYAV